MTELAVLFETDNYKLETDTQKTPWYRELRNMDTLSFPRLIIFKNISFAHPGEAGIYSTWYIHITRDQWLIIGFKANYNHGGIIANNAQ